MSKKKNNKSYAFWDRPQIQAKNHKQKQYLNAIDNHSVIVSTGVAGTGKSYIAAVKAIDMLMDPRSPIERIVIARPNEIEGTKSIGFLKGDKNDKMMPLVAPVADAMIRRIGKGNFDALLKAEQIELLPLEYIKGRSFDNTFVIIDEAEDIEWSILKTLLLRTGRDSKVVIDGDLRQTSISRTSGLQTLWDLMDEFNMPVVHIDFDSWDYCVRSEECALFGRIFETANV